MSSPYLEEVRRLGWWYQDFELPDGTRTGNGQPPSYRPEDRWRFFRDHLPADLSGASVLDVGGNAGYFSAQLALRGASRCVIVEPYGEFAAQARFVGEAFGINLEVVEEDILSYVLSTEDQFDVVVFLGVFYHLRYPTLVLDRVAQMARRFLLFQSLMMDAVGPGAQADDIPVRFDELPRDPATGDAPCMAYLEDSFRGDPTNWWVPNVAAAHALLRSAGHEVIAHPHPELFLTRPVADLGVFRKGDLVLSRYRKADTPGLISPGKLEIPRELWETLVKMRWPE